MRLESLANELLLELFDFLDGVHLFQSFYGLNSRFNHLLLSHHRNFYLNFKHVSKEDFHVICEHLPSISDQVLSLQIHDDFETPRLSELFLQYAFPVNRFSQLKYLSLQSSSSLFTLAKLTSQCQYFPNLISLTMIGPYTQERSKLITVLLNNIWTLSRLTHCHLDGIRGMEDYLLEISKVSSSMKHLSVEDCNIYTFFHLLKYTPNLHQLEITIEQHHQNALFTTVVSSLLTTLKIVFYGRPASLISIFQSLSNLHRLTLETSSITWNGYKWEQVLDIYLPQLKKLQFRIDYPLRNKERMVAPLLDSFRTPFWLLQRQWYVGCQWKPNSFVENVKLYTLPYAFTYLSNDNESSFISTCLDEEKYHQCDRVRHFTYSSKRPSSDNIRLRFSNIRHLRIELPCDASSLSCFSSFDRLRSLHISIKKDFNYRHLQALLNRAPCLYWLDLELNHQPSKELFQLTSLSVRRLDLLSSAEDLYFTMKNCADLISSSFGRQCEVLSVHVDHRDHVLHLIQQMPFLRSLRFQCRDQTSNAELLSWLQNCLPSTYFISECQENSRQIVLWINRRSKVTVPPHSRSFKRFLQNLFH